MCSLDLAQNMRLELLPVVPSNSPSQVYRVEKPSPWDAQVVQVGRLMILQLQESPTRPRLVRSAEGTLLQADRRLWATGVERFWCARATLLER